MQQTIEGAAGANFFTCPFCQRTSANPNDLVYRYCGACGVFVDDYPVGNIDVSVTYVIP